jgi:diacylglycerol O-acyltransferase / wax synthase
MAPGGVAGMMPPVTSQPPLARAVGTLRDERMAAVDCAWLRMDERANLMVIHGVHLFDQPLERGRLLHMLATRLAQVPRFRQRAVRRRGRWHWEEVPSFDAAAHLVDVELPAGAGEAELRALVGRQMDRPLPADRPLWQVQLVQGYGSGSALIWRLHHCLGDGIALMVLMLAITDLHADGDGGHGTHAWGSDNPLADLFGGERLTPAEAMAHLEELLPEGARLLARPGEELARTSAWLRVLGWLPTFARLSLRLPDPRTRFKGRLGGEKRVAWSRAIPLDEVRQAKEAVGGTVNDVLLTAVAGGLRRYLEGRGDRTRGLTFRAVVPVSLRPLACMSDLGNYFGLVFLPLPVGEVDAHRRLERLRRSMLALRRSLEPMVVLHVLGLLGRVPHFVHRLVIRIFGTKGTAVLTSVPGPSRQLFLAGRPIRGLVFWVPQSGRLGLGISIMSYAGQVRLGVASDSSLVPDPEAIVAGFEQELQFLEDLRVGPPAAVAAAS